MKHRERRRGHNKGQEEMQCIHKVRWETQQEQIKNNKTDCVTAVVKYFCLNVLQNECSAHTVQILSETALHSVTPTLQFHHSATSLSIVEMFSIIMSSIKFLLYANLSILSFSSV